MERTTLDVHIHIKVGRHGSNACDMFHVVNICIYSKIIVMQYSCVSENCGIIFKCIKK